MRRLLVDWYRYQRYLYHYYEQEIAHRNNNTDFKEAPLPLSFWIIGEALRHIWWWITMNIMCRYFEKHDWTCEDYGDVENGPIIFTYCKRCGKAPKKTQHHL